jgi:F-type H+-transporting ATPase subunit epsilon
MRLSVATPLDVVVDADDVAHLRAEDDTGAFGILPGHAEFVTALAISVASWRDHQGGEHHVALRGGVLRVSADTIAIATPEALRDDDLHRLEREVLGAFRRQRSEEQAARTDAERLYLAAIREIFRFLRPGRGDGLRRGSGAIELSELER